MGTDIALGAIKPEDWPKGEEDWKRNTALGILRQKGLVGVPGNKWARAEDIVYVQHPAAGMMVPRGTKVQLEDIRADVPRVKHLPLDKAWDILAEENGFSVEWSHGGFPRQRGTGKVAPVTRTWFKDEETEKPVDEERWARGPTKQEGGVGRGSIVLESKTTIPAVVGKKVEEAIHMINQSFLACGDKELLRG